MNTHFIHKVGIDPDPKCKNITNGEFYKCTSDDYFKNMNLLDNSSNISDENNKYSVDVIFIDGMHQCEYVLRDFNNSVKVLNNGGIIFIDDCIPLNYNEQLKIPIRHYYENNILKYGEELTGDVWKFIYHLLKNYKDKIVCNYFHNIEYRGIVKIQIKERFTVDVSYEELNNYNYFEDFNNYLVLLNTLM